jgi:hypothetical protein
VVGKNQKRRAVLVKNGQVPYYSSVTHPCEAGRTERMYLNRTPRETL